MNHLVAVPPAKLREHWEYVKAGLAAIQARTKDDGWIAEDVYHSLRNGTSHLALIADRGFLIYQVLPGDDGAGVLFFWIMHGELADIKSALEAEVVEFAKRLGVARIRWGSPRRWDAVGFGKLIGYVYEVKL